MSNPVRPQRWQPTRLHRPWYSPGKNTGVGCHFLLQCRKEKSERSRLVMSDSLQPHGLQPTRLLCPWNFPGKNTEVGCHSFLQGIFPTQGSDPSFLHLPALAGGFFTTESPGKPKSKQIIAKTFLQIWYSTILPASWATYCCIGFLLLPKIYCMFLQLPAFA